ncbi:tetratricopeptide repeat protein [Burkholderia cepacia]|uniref:tetratricopeptide repeat protein n=1 Tax=Burkholderia cepacia TaxID=292 RepID=UPI001FC7FA97|nr:tetratricopeptide repeat protein [Burkholderia cepacia]
MIVQLPISVQVERLLDRGDLIGAAKLIDSAASLASADASLLAVMSRVMRMRGRVSDAAALAEQALSLDANNGPALVERARQAVAAGDRLAANDWYARAYRNMSAGESWILEWIEMWTGVEDGPDMLDVANRFCEICPANASGWFHLGLQHQCAGQYDAALAAYAHAQQLDPAIPMLQNNVAAAHIELGDLSKAKSILELLLVREPTNALAWNNLSLILLRQSDLAGSDVASERACMLAPDYPVALLTRVQVLKELQQWDAALTTARRAQQLDPANPSIVWAVAMLELARADYVNGWSSHEARWYGAPELRGVSLNFPSPRWNGESLSGKTLFVWGEQGNGDAIQFVRFLPRIAERVHAEGGKLVYCCFARLLPLFARSFADVVDEIVSHDAAVIPAYDFHLPLGSLPLVLGITEERLAEAGPYLKPDPDAVARHGERAGTRQPLRIGLVWSGSRTHQRNPLRAIDPMLYARTFRDIDGVEFVSLQVDAADDVAAMRRAGLSIEDPAVTFGSFDDTATLLSTLDLVLTVCTSVAHLAGALGVPTWLLLDVNPHWVWSTQRADSPWYPSMTLYRQTTYRQWEPVVSRIAADLRRFAVDASAIAPATDEPIWKST